MANISDEKKEYARRLNGLFDKYSKVIFVGVDNVQSQQMHNVRKGLRGKAEILMGKKTMQKRIVSLRAESTNSAADKAIQKKFVEENLLSKNVGLVFTNDDITSIQGVIDKYRVQAPARVGAVAPCDVTIPAGNTGMEPTATSFFQALNIATKISKGTVEIITDKKVLSQGEKVDNSVAALLQKLNISPFFYSLEVVGCWDRGVYFSVEDLKTSDADIEAAFAAGVANVTALSLGAGVPTEASFPHLLTDAFKNLLALSIATEYEFTEFNGASLRKSCKEGVAAAAAAPAPAAGKAPAGKAAAPPPKPKEPEPEEEDDVGLGGLF
jgi:large subunit ribosomal protein LP0